MSNPEVRLTPHRCYAALFESPALCDKKNLRLREGLFGRPAGMAIRTDSNFLKMASNPHWTYGDAITKLEFIV
jgi:hypothetical protein